MLEEAIEAAIAPASVEVFGGSLLPLQLSYQVDRAEMFGSAQRLLDLTYNYPAKTLPGAINQALVLLPGGQNWAEGSV